VPIAAPPPTRTPSRTSGNGPYDRGRSGGGKKSRDRGAKGPPKKAGGWDGRDSYRPNTPQTDPPLPPAPLLDLPSAAALAAAAAMWGLLNPPKNNPGPVDPLPGEIWNFGRPALDMTGMVWVRVTTPAFQNFNGPADSCRKLHISAGSTINWQFVPGGYAGEVNITSTNACGNTGWNVAIKKRDGTSYAVQGGGSSGGAAFLGGHTFEFAHSSGNTAPYSPKPIPLVPFPRPPQPAFPDPLPELEPEEEPLTAPVAPPLPIPAPPVAPPATEPIPPPAPAPPDSDPVAPPAFRPITFPGPTPVPLPLRPPPPPPQPPPPRGAK
jgi:hypothetical protein